MQNENKSFAQRLRESRGEKMDSCPACGNTVEVWHTPQGLVDCYRCGTAPVRTQTILRPGTREPITIPAEEQTQAQQVRDCLREDQRRGESGGGSSSGPSRKKPLKRVTVRWEQESPLFNNGRSGDIKITRFETATESFKLRLTADLLEQVQEECDSRYRDEGEVPLCSVVREAIRERCLHLGNVLPHVRGQEREILQLRIFPSELAGLRVAAESWEESMNDVVVACLREFLGDR